MTDLLDRVVASVETPVAADVEQLKAAYDMLLPIEQQAREELAKTIRSAVPSPHGYQRLNLEVLSWRKKMKLRGSLILKHDVPALAIYDPYAGPLCQIQGGDLTRFYSNMSLPEPVASAWYRTLEFGERQVDLRSEFSGVIPARINAKIFRLTEQNLRPLLLAEAEWVDHSRVQPMALGDPLLVAWSDVSQVLWLVDRFDTTSLEEYIATEFASK